MTPWNQDEELEIVGVKEAHEVGPQEVGVADKAGSKTGRWKPAGTGPRGGACGQMPADMPTPNRRCRREYPRICSGSSKPCPVWGPSASVGARASAGATER